MIKNNTTTEKTDKVLGNFKWTKIGNTNPPNIVTFHLTNDEFPQYTPILVLTVITNVLENKNENVSYIVQNYVTQTQHNIIGNTLDEAKNNAVELLLFSTTKNIFKLRVLECAIRQFTNNL